MLFYPQSWALVHYLMQGHPDGRFILFDVLTGGKYRSGHGGLDGNKTAEARMKVPPGVEEPSDEDDASEEDEEEEDEEEEDGAPTVPPGRSEPRARPSRLPRDFREVLSDYGLTLDRLEQLCKEYYRTLK